MSLMDVTIPDGVDGVKGSPIAVRVTLPWKEYVPWFFLLALFAILVLVVAPNRGAPWDSDDALFLRMSWDAAHGFGLDTMLPQSPSYLFHALLIKMGMGELLHFRYVNYGVAFLSSLLFFLGLDRRGFRSPIVPLAICATVLNQVRSIENPNTLSMAFFLGGSGLYFMATYASKNRRDFFLLSSALGLAIAGFMHAASMIAMGLLSIVFWVIDPAIRRSLFFPVFYLVSFLLWYGYISMLGMDLLLRPPAAHTLDALTIVIRLFLIGSFHLFPVIFYCVIVLASLPFKIRKWDIAQRVASVLVTMYCWVPISFLMGEEPYSFDGWIKHSSVMTGYAFFLLTFILLRRIGNHWPRERSPLLQMRSSPDIRHTMGAVCGLVLLPSTLSVGSNAHWIHGMNFFAGPVLGVLFLLWERVDPRSKILKILQWSWLGLFVLLALTHNHPVGRLDLTSSDRVTLHAFPLSGIRETTRYATVLQVLKEVYEVGKCHDKTLITLDYIPLIYTILQHPAPNETGVVRPAYYFPEDRMISSLQAASGWCVIDVTSGETQEDIRANHGRDKRTKIREKVETQSDYVIDFPTPGPPLIGNARLFVRLSMAEKEGMIP